MTLPFADHFSAVAAEYASARPEYPDALFDWIATQAPARALAWEAGCGSGQASRGLARHFARVFATDPAAAQIEQAHAPGNVTFAVEPGEHCSLGDASVDAVCVAQALHWFDRPAFFRECARVLKPAGVLIAWGYQDIVVPPDLQAANDALQHAIARYWPAERALIDSGYAGFDWPFASVAVPELTLQAQWSLPRLLGYFASYTATRRCRDATGEDPVARHAAAFAAAWGDPDVTRTLHWPLFIHARRKAHAGEDGCSPA
jgi:SAM-dependent methyltransferase